jgi:hypothetical protein
MLLQLISLPVWAAWTLYYSSSNNHSIRWQNVRAAQHAAQLLIFRQFCIECLPPIEQTRRLLCTRNRLDCAGNHINKCSIYECMTAPAMRTACFGRAGWHDTWQLQRAASSLSTANLGQLIISVVPLACSERSTYLPASFTALCSVKGHARKHVRLRYRYWSAWQPKHTSKCNFPLNVLQWRAAARGFQMKSDRHIRHPQKFTASNTLHNPVAAAVSAGQEGRSRSL